MIEWKDVNKELPEKSCNVKCKTIDFDGDKTVEEFSFIKMYNCFNSQTDHFFKNNNFNGTCQEYGQNIGVKITHWAYINEPNGGK